MENQSIIHQELQRELDRITHDLVHLTEGLAFQSLPSTNDYAAYLEKQGYESGTIVMAAEQFSGRGRLNRSWLMQAGDIALTILLRPPFLPKNCALLPMLPALAVVEALAQRAIPARLKWPNDIIIESHAQPPVPYLAHFRKVGGILVENVFRDGEIAASIIGIGLNVTSNPKLTKTIPHAASLADYSPNINRFSCLRSLLTCLDQKITGLTMPRYEAQMLADYSKSCETIGRTVVVEIAGVTVTGQVSGIKADGSLVVSDGRNDYTIFAGDVNFLVL